MLRSAGRLHHRERADQVGALRDREVRQLGPGPTVNPALHGITADGITVEGAGTYAVEIAGLPGSHARDVEVTNSTFTSVSKGGNRTVNADGVTFMNVTVNGKAI